MSFSAANPAGSLRSYGALTSTSVDRMRNAGIPDDVIATADDMLTGSSSASVSNTSYTAPTNPSVPAVGPAAFGIDVAASSQVVDDTLNEVDPQEQGSNAPAATTNTGETETTGKQSLPILDDPGRIVKNVGGVLTGALNVDNGTYDKTFTSLMPRHVAIFRAIGLPDSDIKTLNDSSPSPMKVEEQLQQLIAQPEAVDQALNLPTGTTAQKFASMDPELLKNPAGEGVQSIPLGPTGDADTYDSTYTNMMHSHVTLLKKVGTTEAMMQQMNNMKPNPTEMETYLTRNVVENPEFWDSQMGNQSGTARQGLMSIGFTAADIDGTSGNTGAGTGSDGTPLPGTGTTGTVAAPKSDGGNDMIKNIVIALAVGGAGFLLYKMLHKAPKLAPATEQMLIQNGIMQAGQKLNKNQLQMLINAGVVPGKFKAIKAMGGFAQQFGTQNILAGAGQIQGGGGVQALQQLPQLQALQGFQGLQGLHGLQGVGIGAGSPVSAPVFETGITIRQGLADAGYLRGMDSPTLMANMQQYAATNAGMVAQLTAQLQANAQVQAAQSLMPQFQQLYQPGIQLAQGIGAGVNPALLAALGGGTPLLAGVGQAGVGAQLGQLGQALRFLA